MSGTPAPGRLVADLRLPSAPGAFSDEELDGLPEPVRRYFRAAIAPSAPLAASARLRMRGSLQGGIDMSVATLEALTTVAGHRINMLRPGISVAESVRAPLKLR